MDLLKQFSFSFILLTIFIPCSFSQSENIWVTFEEAPSLTYSSDGKIECQNTSLQALIDQHHITGIEQALSNSRKPNLQKVYEVTCDCDVLELMLDINSKNLGLSNPEIGPNYRLLYDPNDYFATFSSDYALDLIKAKGAWDYSHGDSNVIIGICDANYHLANIDLIGKWLSFSSPNNNPNYEHGTAVALTAAGNTDNGVGKSAIGFNCRLNLRSISYNNVLDLSYAGSRAINVSWYSSCFYSAYVQEVVDEVYQNGGIIVAAAGNGTTCAGPSNLVFPASCDHVISVTSIGPSDNHEQIISDTASTHQHNTAVDICAPGYDIATGSSWTFGPVITSGTSFAAPYVTGTIGLMLAIRPCLTFEDVENLLKESATNIDLLNPNYAGLLGAGRLDAHRTLKFTYMGICNLQEPSVFSHGDPHSFANLENEPSSDLSADIKISYNPINGNPIMSWMEKREFELIVSNIHGQVIHKEHVDENVQFSEIELASKGMYFVQFISNGQQMFSDKILKVY
ncbi:MAG: hypothetical protein A3D92_02915 [Bacteroidetes bacterium RIFCSPHIGHO2_02_FULL_44_7]|nr:MAG: hypothetical protein A3D92_02915 [Bacteroidetes bacterium RIFCSPHIGHO2_02_FULL_44_7]